MEDLISVLERNIDRTTAAWPAYAAYFAGQVPDSALVKQIESQVGGEMLAKVIVWHLGENSQKWLDVPLDALDGIRPIDLLHMKKEEVLKAFLMRFPC